MKINTMFNIDDDLVQELKNEKNRSALVCELLREHYNKISLVGLSKEELKRVIQIETLKDEYKTKLEAINDK